MKFKSETDDKSSHHSMPGCKRGRHKVHIIIYNERISSSSLRKSVIYTANKATIKDFFGHLKAGRGY